MKSSKCPYCGKTISYLTAFAIRRKGEYFCKKCKKESNVYIKKTIWLLFMGMAVLSLLGLAYFLLLTERDNLWFIPLVMAPFILFYLLSPLFVTLRPKKKFQDSLYDTQMVDSQKADPDPTIAQSAKVVPAFVDDLVLGDEDFKPTINSDVFNAIKEERKVVADVDGGTKSFDKFENISSGASMENTMAVDNLSDIPKIKEEKAAAAADTSYDLSNFE